jgi:uncharacterized phage protein (TIGR02218 family)
MKQLSAALQAHLEGEYLTIATCVRITRTDGVELRITDHDKRIRYLGDYFEPAPSFDLSAIKSSSDLSVDNADITIGMSSAAGSLLSRQHVERGLYRGAEFEVFVLNWADVSMGRMLLKRGTVGDITINNPTQVVLQLRGLTQALRRSPVEMYSPTCRAGFGGTRCGFANLPTRIRLDGNTHRTSDWYMVPFSAVHVTLNNGSFEAGGVVANGASGITGWTYGEGSYWKTSNTFAGVDGSYYLEGGDDGQGAATGQPVTLSQSIATSAAGMSSALVDSGHYAAAFSLNIANTDTPARNIASYTIRQYDAAGNVLRADKSVPKVYKYGQWTKEQTVVFLIPGVRRLELTLYAYKNTGNTASLAFDDVRFSWWENTPTAFGDKMFKVCRFPAYGISERLPVGNASFDDNGAVPNGVSGITGWVYGGYWETVATYASLPAFGSGYFLKGGDDGSSAQSTYTLTKTKLINVAASDPLDPYILPSAIDAGRISAHLRYKAARFNAGSEYAVRVDYLSAAGGVLGTNGSGFVSSGALGVWTDGLHSSVLPTGTRGISVVIQARSPVGDSHAQIGIDTLSVHLLNTTLEAVEDPATAAIATTLPATLAGLPTGSFTFDGSALVQARPLIFDVSSITTIVPNSSDTFEAGLINKTANVMQGGRIVWLTGVNAGQSSYIRVWDNTTKRLQTFEPPGGLLAVGDKFMYAEGCNKTITDCATRFANSTNFRGEPYLPGTTKVIEFFANTKV